MKLAPHTLPLSSHTPQVTAALARITTYTQTNAKLFLTQTPDMTPALETVHLLRRNRRTSPYVHVHTEAKSFVI